MYDLLIRTAQIIDGSGKPAFTGDIGIIGERIVALGSDLEGDAQNIIDATSQVVSPGFIDAHTHDDRVIMRQRIALPKIHQGITTLVIGNCGFGMAPMVQQHMHEMQSYAAAVLGQDDDPWHWPSMDAFMESLRTRPLGQQVCALLGHTTVRVAVMGFAARPASEQEMIAQGELVAEAMQAGAVGLSLGLMYVPGMYTPTTELVRLARIVGRYGGVVTAHMRGEGDHMLASLDEMLAIAEQAEVAVHISHLKMIGHRNWGSIGKALERITDARARGHAITVDMYPYTAGSTTITQLLPPWILAGGLEQTLHSLRDPAIRRRVSQDFAQGLPGWDNQVEMLGWERIMLASMQQESNRVLEGLSIAEAAKQLGLTTEETFFHLLLTEEGRITIVVFSMDEHDVDQVIQSPFAMVGSDGLPLASGRPHPRLYGTFPRYIKRYVRELKSLSLEAAIHKITAFPAARFGLAEHGLIQANKIADLVIFDPSQISDQATYNEPQRYPDGIATVIVSGKPIVRHNQLQTDLPGHLLTPSSNPSEVR